MLAAFQRSLGGPLDDGEVVGLDFDALADAAPPLSVSRIQLVAQPHLLRRFLASLVLARSNEHSWSPEFRALLVAACRDLPYERSDDAGRGAVARSGAAASREFEGALDRLRKWLTVKTPLVLCT